jgi:hypothetical protein
MPSRPRPDAGGSSAARSRPRAAARQGDAGGREGGRLPTDRQLGEAVCLRSGFVREARLRLDHAIASGRGVGRAVTVQAREHEQEITRASREQRDRLAGSRRRSRTGRNEDAIRSVWRHKAGVSGAFELSQIT